MGAGRRAVEQIVNHLKKLGSDVKSLMHTVFSRVDLKPSFFSVIVKGRNSVLPKGRRRLVPFGCVPGETV